MAGPRRHSRSTIARAAAAVRGAGESRAAARAVVDGEDSAACGREKSRGKSRENPGIGSGRWMEVSIDGIERSPRKIGAIVYTFLFN